MDSQEQVGHLIRKLRTQKGLTLTELARQAGISKGYVSQIERGATGRPSAQVLHGIASVLGVSAAGLLGMPTDGAETEIVISKSLRDFAKSAHLTDEEVAMLARVRYRGRQPQAEDDWRFLFESIKRSVSGDR